jgi:hypothetical protein
MSDPEARLPQLGRRVFLYLISTELLCLTATAVLLQPEQSAHL